MPVNGFKEKNAPRSTKKAKQVKSVIVRRIKSSGGNGTEAGAVNTTNWQATSHGNESTAIGVTPAQVNKLANASMSYY